MYGKCKFWRELKSQVLLFFALPLDGWRNGGKERRLNKNKYYRKSIIFKGFAMGSIKL